MTRRKLSGWRPDDALLDDAVEQLAQSLEILKEKMDPRTASDALEFAGTLSLLDREQTAVRAFESSEIDTRAVVESAFSSLDAAQLDRAVSEVLALSDDLRCASEEERSALEESIVDALSVRDSAALLLEGARCVLPPEPAVPFDFATSLSSFDALIAEELWKLLSLGARREARCIWASPSKRQLLWWWHRGCDLPRTALDDLVTAAKVIQVFPQVREEFDALVVAERDLEVLRSALAAKEDEAVGSACARARENG